MINYILPSICAGAIALVLISYWIKVCHKWNLFESLDDRKKHKHQIPTMGGIGIFAGIYFSFILFGNDSISYQMRFVLASSMLLFFTGFFDDLIEISASKKLLIQISAALLISYGGMRFNSLFGLFGIEEIPVWCQYLTTVIFVVLITNAYNLVDGIDGLAGSLGMLSSLIFGSIFILQHQTELALLSFCMAGALLGFLVYNFNPAKIFMGDTGSLIVGFLLAIHAINCLAINNLTPGSIVISPSLVVAILFVPVYDVARVSMIRILTGYSPFRPDRNHVHHMIMSQGFGQRVTAMIILIINSMFVVMSVIFSNLNINLFLIMAVCLGMITINTLVMSYLANIWGKLGGKIYNKHVLTA
jgi:UDP-GlcNAc:undecaprenyl-phosphate GlcNAc-1-phosphate transferase